MEVPQARRGAYRYVEQPVDFGAVAFRFDDERGELGIDLDRASASGVQPVKRAFRIGAREQQLVAPCPVERPVELGTFDVGCKGVDGVEQEELTPASGTRGRARISSRSSGCPEISL